MDLSWQVGSRFATLSAVHSGYSPQQVQIYTALLHGPKEIRRDLVLREGCALTGRAAVGESVAVGARVQTVASGMEHYTQRLTWTDGEGRFFAKTAPGKTYTVMISHAVLGHAAVTATCPADGSVHDLGIVQLAPTSILLGRVCYKDGEGVPNLPVRVGRTSGSFLKGGRRGGWSGYGRTSDNGYFRFQGLEAGEYVFHPIGLTLRESPKLDHVLRTGDECSDILLPYHRIRITLKDPKGERILPAYARVRWKPLEGLPRDMAERGVSPQENDQRVSLDRLVVPGSSWSVCVSAGSLEGAREIHTLKAANETRVDLILHAK